eukprot:GEMP01047022.1.p1 GENE.GEMP01047022.1~~GEMP01047022.1.p1  ORF type:complete len:343 (-),score=51.69 GEMP01047022.1:699-1691(-)
MANLGKVLVTGATGRVGKEVVARLAKSGKCTVRAALHSPSKDDYLKSLGAHETVPFDLTDQKTWRNALDGVSVIFSSTQDQYIQEHMEFAKFLGANYKNQIRHVVRISCFGADTNTAAYDKDVHVSRANAGVPIILQHYWWSEECFITQGFPVTSIRGNFYMNHLLKNELTNIKEHGFFQSPLGDCRNSFVSCNDMAEAAVTCILEGHEKHANKFYDITGAQPQSMHEVARDLSEVLGQKVEYRPQDIVQFEADFGPARTEFFEYLRNGFYSRCSSNFYNLTGHRPLTYKEYLTTKGAAGDTGIEELFSAQGSLFTKGVDKFANIANVEK